MLAVNRANVAEATAFVSSRTGHHPKVGLVLGSGLGGLADAAQATDIIPYQDIPFFPQSTVPGHVGRLILGQISEVEVVIMQGRVHYYEGYSMSEITFGIRLMHSMGAKTLIVTNAAGGIRQDLGPGDLMAIEDHINLVGLAGQNPLVGPNDKAWGARFPSMSRAYDPRLLASLLEEAARKQVPLQKGVYAMVAGPSFETPAEIRFLRLVGADAVGMSTMPEVIVARHAGMRVLGVSLITNRTVDSLDAMQEEPLHDHVLQAGERAAPALASLLQGVLRRLG